MEEDGGEPKMRNGHVMGMSPTSQPMLHFTDESKVKEQEDDRRKCDCLCQRIRQRCGRSVWWKPCAGRQTEVDRGRPCCGCPCLSMGV